MTKEDIIFNIKYRIMALKSLSPKELEANKGNLWELEDLLSMIENEEVMDEDLEEISRQYALNNTPYEDCADEIQEAFKAGARWQKEQMMKDIITAHVFGREFGKSLFCFKVDGNKYLVGHEVKIIIVKED